MKNRVFAIAVLSLGIAAGGMAQVDSSVQAQEPAAQADAAKLPTFVRNGLPGPNHERLNALIGDWKVEKSTYIAIGTRDKPVQSSDIVTHRRWIAGGRFIEDETQGTIAGSEYYRQGFLGYSNIDHRYEWVTADALNSNMMIYHGKTGDRAETISMTGVFTDQGVLGDRTIGKSIPMRTVIRIDSPDRHEFELYMTPPGGREFLADRMVYTRQGP